MSCACCFMSTALLATWRATVWPLCQFSGVWHMWFDQFMNVVSRLWASKKSSSHPTTCHDALHHRWWYAKQDPCHIEILFTVQGRTLICCSLMGIITVRRNVAWFCDLLHFCDVTLWLIMHYFGVGLFVIDAFVASASTSSRVLELGQFAEQQARMAWRSQTNCQRVWPT